MEFVQREPAPPPGQGLGAQAVPVDGNNNAMVPRDPFIPRAPEEQIPSDEIELFDGVKDPLPQKPPTSDKAQREREAEKKRHRTLIGTLDDEGERQREERQQSQTDDDYYHHLQWTAEQARVLASRGQAPLVFNVARGTIDWMCGTERRLRKDWKIRPREKSDEAGAELKTKVVKYVSDVNLLPWHMSGAAKQMFTSGLGWMEAGVNTDPEREMIYVGSEDWRRIFRDSRGREFDQEDWRFTHRRKILDLDYAQALLPRGARHLANVAGRWGVNDEEQDDVWYLGERLTNANSMQWAGTNTGIFGDGYTLRSAGSAVFDYGRRRSVEVLESWYRVPMAVKVFAGGPLYRKIVNPADPRHQQLLQDRHPVYETVKQQMRVMVGTRYEPIWDGPSPYNHGRFPLIPMWGYRRGRDGMVYGAMRGMRDPQDDLNKRRSKALAHLSSNKVIFKQGAFEDIEDARQEIARTDGMIEVVGEISDIKIVDPSQQTQQNMEMAMADEEHIRNSGGVTGENLGQNTSAQSGKAIIAKQEQGSMVTYELFDNYFLCFKLLGQQVLANIEQFCNQEWTIRIDPAGMKPAEWVTVNKFDPATGTYKDDITAAQADFIVDQQDYRATLTQSAMQSMFELLSSLATFAPQVVLNLLDLVVDSADVPGKEEWVARIRKMTGQRDPTKPPTPEEIAADQKQQAKQAMIEGIEIGTAQAKMDELKAKINGTNAKAVLDRLSGLMAAMETVALAATMPGLAPAADATAMSAGFEDQTPATPIVGEPPAAPPQAPVLPGPDSPEPGSTLPPADGAQPPMPPV